jgi:hypothetical protein
VCERPTAGPAILRSHPSGDWLSFGASPFLTPLPPPRAERGATRHLTRLGSECEFVIRTYVGSRLFYEADRDLDLQLSRSTDHVETWSPPYVVLIVSVVLRQDSPSAAATDMCGRGPQPPAASSKFLGKGAQGGNRPFPP